MVFDTYTLLKQTKEHCNRLTCHVHLLRYNTNSIDYTNACGQHKPWWVDVITSCGRAAQTAMGSKSVVWQAYSIAPQVRSTVEQSPARHGHHGIPCKTMYSDHETLAETRYCKHGAGIIESRRLLPFNRRCEAFPCVQTSGTIHMPVHCGIASLNIPGQNTKHHKFR